VNWTTSSWAGTTNVMAAGLVTSSFDLDTRGLPEGIYTGLVSVVSTNAGTIDVPVSIAVGTRVLTTVWDGGGADSNVTTEANWSYNSLPFLDGSSEVYFGQSGSVSAINTNVSFLGMCFNRDSDFTLANGGGVLTLGAAGITVASTMSSNHIYTLAPAIHLASGQTWDVGTNAATMIVSGSVDDGASACDLLLSGSGVFYLAGNSSYDGVTTISSGVVARVVHSHALGSTNGMTTVASNAWIEVGGNVAVVEPLTVADASRSGALRSTDGTNTWLGRLTQTAPSRVRSLAGSRLTLAGGVTGAYSFSLSPDAGGEIVTLGSPVNLGSTASTRVL
jgi:autotransporter-associated beta strand protein